MIIKSKTNSLIKEVNKLKQKKYRTNERKYIAEGKKLVNEAIEYQKKNIETILASVSYVKKNNVEKGIVLVEDEIFEYISEDKNPEGIMAILKLPEDSQIDYNASEIVILNEIRDPGNMGTILRTLDALGIKQVILTGDIVDPYMPKVVRSSMGAIFRINIIYRKLNKLIEILKEKNYEISATDMDGENIYTINKGKYAIIFNNESYGLEDNLKSKIIKKIMIPMPGQAESLNVAMSVGIIMYEFYRKNNFN